MKILDDILIITLLWKTIEMTINESQCICYKDYANDVNTIVQVSGPMYS